MKKSLLSMAALALTMSANAQLLTYDFESVDGSKIVSENWQEESFPSVDNNFDFSKAEVGVGGSKALYVKTAGSCQNWERVIAILNTGVAENTAYKISLKAKGTGTLNLGILKGCFNHDKALLLDGMDQVKDFELSDADDFQTIEYTVWSPSRSIMTAAKSDFTEDQYWAQDFLRLNFKGEGEYCIDDVVIEEVAPVTSAVFNGSAIQLKFMGPTNVATLAQAGGEDYVELDKSSVSVKVNDEDADVVIIEIKKDGSLTIFLDESVALAEEDKVEVTFNNGVGLIYTDTEEAIKSFTATPAYNFDFSATASAYAEAELVSATPANKSFEIPASTTTFSFTFNKPVSTYDEENEAPTAVLVGPSIEEDLEVVANDELSKTLVFKRKESGDLADGTYYLTVDNVCNALSVATTTPFELSFEVGAVKAATTVYGEATTTLLEGAGGGQPTNWSILVGGENWTGGNPKEDNGSACRNLNVTGSDGVERTAFYLCDRDGYTYMMYGDKEDATITLPAGDLEFSVIALSHDDAGHTLEFVLEDMEGNQIATASDACSIVANTSFTSIEASNKVSAKFNNPTEQNVILKIHAPQGGYTAVRVLGFSYRTYSMSDGDKYEPEVLFASSFSGGNMPAEGTGWLCYDNNNQLTPGAGRSGTSGMLERNFHKKMQSAAFFRECGANENAAHRIEYGNGNGVEGGVEIAAGTYDVVYYAGTWNDNGGNAAGNSKVYLDIIDAETGDVVSHSEHVNVANFENGGACNGQADEVRVSVALDGGKYIFKAWGTTNTVWGSLSIEIPGKTAVMWHERLDEAVVAAAEVLNSAEDDKYNGTTKTKLNDLVEKYSVYPNGMTTAEEYNATIGDINATAKAMTARCTAVDAYNTDMAKITSSLEEIIGTKYEALAIVTSLQNLYDKYADVAATSLEDDELIPVQQEVTAGVNGLGSAKDAVSKYITKQIQNLIEEIAENAVGLEGDVTLGWQAKGENAVTDDQEIAAELQKILTACIYNRIAKGYEFSTYDEDMEDNLADSLNVTGYIANNMFYTTQSIAKAQAIDHAAFPNWNIEGNVSNIWWWEGNLTVDAGHPAVDASIRNLGGNAFKVNQVLKNLPVGKYTMIMKTADMTNVDLDNSGNHNFDESLPWSNSFIYAAVGEDSTKTVANYGKGMTWRNATATYLTDIEANVAEGEYTLEMVIGADMNCTKDAAQVDECQLFMTGKADGFDYAAAAQALFGSIPSALKAVERTDAPVAVQYYNVAGQKTAAKGVNIKVERYADGYTVIKKVIVK